MMFCWCAPPRILSVRNRDRFLLWLDALGKWSLIDAYVLVLMMVAFRFHIATTASMTYLPHNFVILDVIVEPQWGIYGFLVAGTATAASASRVA